MADIQRRHGHSAQTFAKPLTHRAILIAEEWCLRRSAERVNMALPRRTSIGLSPVPVVPPFVGSRCVVQDSITQMLFCVALGCALSVVVAAALSRSDRKPLRPAILPRLVVAAGPVYLGANYVVYQGSAAAICTAAAFALVLCGLRGWWLPKGAADAVYHRFRGVPTPVEGQPVPTRSSVFYLAGWQRGASAERAALRSRIIAVVRADRHAARPDDSSMPSAA
jgi:hypothetical protein